jgi:hypothetical protein
VRRILPLAKSDECEKNSDALTYTAPAEPPLIPLALKLQPLAVTEEPAVHARAPLPPSSAPLVVRDINMVEEHCRGNDHRPTPAVIEKQVAAQHGDVGTRYEEPSTSE